MGIFDTIKELLGSTSLGDVVESTGIADQVGGLTDAVQAPVEDLSAAAEEVTAVVDPLADQI